MKLRGLLCGALAAILPSNPIWAQGIPAAAPAYGKAVVSSARNADEAWSAVTTLAQPKPATATLKDTPSSVLHDELSQTERLIQASQAAQAFYGRFTSDTRASQGKKQETVYALQAVQFGAAEYKTTAYALGTAYRADKKNSDSDRYDVAFTMEGITLAETLKGKRFIDDGEKYEHLADTLYAELGDTDEVYGLYVSIVRTTDVVTSTRVSNKLLQLKKAPDWVKTQAQTAVDRAALIGKPVNFKLTTIGGTTIDLSRPNDRPTVLYFWHAAGGPADFAALEHFKPSFAVDARWIYVGLGSAPPVSDRPMKGSPFADSHCYESAQPGKPSTNYLKVPYAPYAFVLDPAGRLVGYGFPENIAALLQAAKR